MTNYYVGTVALVVAGFEDEPANVTWQTLVRVETWSSYRDTILEETISQTVWENDTPDKGKSFLLGTLAQRFVHAYVSRELNLADITVGNYSRPHTQVLSEAAGSTDIVIHVNSNQIVSGVEARSVRATPDMEGSDHE